MVLCPPQGCNKGCLAVIVAGAWADACRQRCLQFQLQSFTFSCSIICSCAMLTAWSLNEVPCILQSI